MDDAGKLELGTTSRSLRSSACGEGLAEIARGLTVLAAALFLFVWSSFDWAIVLALVAFSITGGHVFLRTAGNEPGDGNLARQLTALFGPVAAGWRLVASMSMLLLLAILGVVRIAALAGGERGSMASSDVERWLPAILTSMAPFWFVISGVLNRLPRHLLVGFIGFAGAAVGPLLGLAWRDSLALAAAIFGIVLIADGGYARHWFCRGA